MKTFVKLFLIILLIGLTGCIRQSDSEFGSLINIKRGNELIGLADRQFYEYNLISAELSYEKALKEFSMIDHFEGKSRALLGIARVNILTGKREKVFENFAKVENMSFALSPELKFLLLSARVEYNKTFGLTDSVLILTNEWDKFDSQDQKMQFLSYRILARTDIGKSDAGELNSAEKLFAAYYEEDPYKLECKLYSIALLAYTIGLQKYYESDLSGSEIYLQHALRFDKIAGNYSGIGENLYILGLIAERNKNYSLAEDYFNRALNIFEQLGISERVELARANLGLQRIRLNLNSDAEEKVLRDIYSKTKNNDLKQKISSIIKGL